MPAYARRTLNVRGRHLVSGRRAGGASDFIRSGLTYTRGDDDSIKVFLTSVGGGGVADALELTAFSVNDTPNFGIVTENAVSAQLADTTAPGALVGTGTKVTAMSGAVVGVLYLISYEVTAVDPDATLFLHAPGPFDFMSLPTSIGIHHVLVTAKRSNELDAIRKGGTGDTTVSIINIKRGEWNADLALLDAGDEIAFTIARGEVDSGTTVTVPTASEIYVDPNGSDTLGTGAEASPYQSPGLVVLGPGEHLVLEQGVYDPFEVQGNGADGNPAIVRSRPGFERQTIIRGDLQQHVAYGGPGVVQNNATRDGIRIAGKNYITIRGLTCEYVWRNGIFVIGNGADTVSGNIIIEDCFTQHTGLSGILVCGDLPENPVPADDAFRMQQVRIRRNELTQTNVVTDFNDTVENSFGEPGGVGEALTVANSVRYVYTSDNHVHTTRQYGIDYKNHVVDGEITGNRVDAAIRYAIYLDAGETDIRRIVVSGNRMSNCRAGLVLAREEDGNDSGDNLVMEDIDIFNNRTWNMSRVGMQFQRHPTKDQQNIGWYRRIRARFNAFFNTNTDGIYRDINIDDIASFGNNIAGDPIVSGIELIGNVAWNPDGAMHMAIDVAADGRFIVAQNYNVQDGTFTGTDVLYVDPTADEPDFTIQDASPAKGIVTTASYIAAPFAVDAGGNTRTNPASAGAYHRNAALHSLSITDNDGATPDAVSLVAEEAGTVYAGVYPSGTVVADIDGDDLRAGTDTDQIGSAYEIGTVTAGGGNLTGVSVSPTGLTGGTDHFLALVQDINDAGVYSNIVGAEFEANAAASVAVNYLSGEHSGDASSPAQTTKTLTLNMTSHTASNRVAVALGAFSNSATSRSFDTVTLNSVAATQIINVAGPDVYTAVAVFPAQSYPASSTLSATFSGGSTTFNIGAAAYDIPPTGTVALLTAQATSTRNSSDVSGTVTAGQGVICATFVTGTAATQEPAWSGDVTQDVSIDARSSDYLVTASAGDVTAGTLTATTSATTVAKTSAISVQISP